MTSLGTLLIKHGWITKQQLGQAISMQREVGGRLGTCLLEMGIISEELLDRSLAEQQGVPAASAENLRAVPDTVSRLLPAPIAIRYRAVPFRASHSEVDIAMLQVDNLWLQDELSFIVGRRLSVYIANEARIVEALARYYRAPCSDRFVKLLEDLNRRLETREETAPHPASRLLRPRPSVVGTSEPEPTVAQAPRSRSSSQAVADPPAVAAQATPSVARENADTIPVSTEELEMLGAAPATTERTKTPIAPALLYSRDLSSEQMLPAEQAEAALAEVSDPEEVGRLLLAALSRQFTRVLLFQVTGKGVKGWLGSGPGLDSTRLSACRLSFDEPSIFLNLRQGGSFFLGVLPEMSAHLELASCWGKDLSDQCAVFPIRVRGRLAALIYADRGPLGLESAQLQTLRRLADAASRAFERRIMERRRLGSSPQRAE